VTVLFVEIVNFARTSKKLGSEATYLVVDEVMHNFAEVVYKYEGTIDKVSGEGLMALFGIPINHENDPERAVRAALDMHASMQPIRARCKIQYDIELLDRSRITITWNTL
jgi:adenylate cyclase